METHGTRAGLCVAALGSPPSPDPSSVRTWLRQFLSDPRVLRMPAPIRWLLLETVILPFRPARSARAWQRIWDPERGSPLTFHTEDFTAGLIRHLPDVPVRMGVRYGAPAMAEALDGLASDGCGHFFVLPCYPQWADSTTGSTEAEARRWARSRGFEDRLEILPPFHDQPAFVAAEARAIGPLMSAQAHLLLSYHGLPESHIRSEDPSGRCLADPGCCAHPGPRLARCYRAQCVATSEAIRTALGLDASRCHTAFQSRFGPVRWIGPSTQDALPALARAGVQDLVVACPSFAADCLETLEEIGIAGKELFLAAGGRNFSLAPAPNGDPQWAADVGAWLRPLTGSHAGGNPT